MNIISTRIPKIWLCGMTSAGNLDNLKAMIEPVIEYFDGLIFTFHYPTDEGADFLEKNKKAGEIIYAKWVKRHQYSQNHFLYQGPMKEGDYFILLDSMERISPEFCKNHLPKMLDYMKENNVALISNCGKGLLFRYNELAKFEGSPHWYITGIDGHTANVELEKTHFWNVRGEQRDKFHFIDHYAKYYIDYPAGSNHCLLGLEKNGDPMKLFPLREHARLAFRKLLESRGIEVSYVAVKEYIKANKILDPEMKEFFNTEKILNDFYRYHVLGDFSIVDNHDFNNKVKI